MRQHTEADLLAFGEAVRDQVAQELGEDGIKAKIAELETEINTDPRATSVLGRAHLHENKVQLFLACINHHEYTDTALEDVIRHEISHFLAWRLDRNAYHDVRWRRRAEQCGAYPRASANIDHREQWAATRERRSTP